MAYDYLVDHGIKNVWCNPDQDRQHIIAPQRITPSLGVRTSCRVMQREITLPSSDGRYHVFQIGQIHPLMLGLIEIDPEWTNETWMSFSSSMINSKMIVDLYTDLGYQLPRFEAFYMMTHSRALIVAIKENAKLPIDYKTTQIYIRVYSNAYFESVRSDALVDVIYVTGKNVKNTEEILSLQNEYNTYSLKTGLTTVFVNGLLIEKLSLATVQIGDVVEFVYDSSVKRVVTLTVDTLPVFDSTLDDKRKYLLHYSASNLNEFDYHDDIDIYVIDPHAANRYYGTYYHRNLEEACRMVTHRDYSILVSNYVHLTQALQTKAGDRVLDLRQLQIRLHIRKSGYNRSLGFENNRIKELYKMDDGDVIEALASTNGPVALWQAASLEASYFTQLMRIKGSLVDRALIQKAYGYNGVSKLLADTPAQTQLFSNKQQISVPYGLQLSCTAYEYDAEGVMIGHYYHSGGDVYTAVDTNCRFIELYYGKGNHQPDVYFGTTNIPISDYLNYRVYRCQTTTLGIDDNWVDITGSNEYTITNNVLVWNNLSINQFLMIRTDNRFLAYDLNIVPTDGSIKFSFSEMENRFGESDHYILPVPLGELDIFLNGKSLIENLDYIVNFPEVVIINKEYLKAPANGTLQHIHIRFCGFCNHDLTRDVPDDQGFIEHGYLSKNNKFDIRDDRVMRIVIDGQLYIRDELEFSEEHSGISVVDVDNGKPYFIKDIVVPIRNLTNEDTYTYRAKSIAIDKTIGDYLTLKLPEPIREAVSSIQNRYAVFSPFIAKILYDLKSKEITAEEIERNLTDNEVLAICKQYEPWLKYDPTQPDHTVDSNFVIIHPHNHYTTVSLNLYQYRFLLRVIKLYCNGLVELSSFIQLESAV